MHLQTLPVITPVAPTGQEMGRLPVKTPKRVVQHTPGCEAMREIRKSHLALIPPPWIDSAGKCTTIRRGGPTIQGPAHRTASMRPPSLPLVIALVPPSCGDRRCPAQLPAPIMLKAGTVTYNSTVIEDQRTALNPTSTHATVIPKSLLDLLPMR